MDQESEDKFVGDPLKIMEKNILRSLEATEGTDQFEEVTDKCRDWYQEFALADVLLGERHGEKAPSISELWSKACKYGDSEALFELLSVYKTLAGAR